MIGIQMRKVAQRGMCLSKRWGNHRHHELHHVRKSTKQNEIILFHVANYIALTPIMSNISGFARVNNVVCF